MLSFDEVFRLESLGQWPLWAVAAAVLLISLHLTRGSAQDGKTPPSIPEWIPGLSNTYRFMFHNMEFLNSLKYTLLMFFFLINLGAD
jgi:hypothetical protein